MIAPRGSDLAAALLTQRPGWFVPIVRNRPVGRETLVWVPRLDGGLEVSAETTLTSNGLILQQSMVAAYDGDLRPERCAVTTTIDSRETCLEIEVGRSEAGLHYRSDGVDECRVVPLRARPLLLVDNCFTSHALAASVAVAAIRRGREVLTFQSLPVDEKLEVGPGGETHVLLGGADLGTPSITMHLGSDLDEHIWMSSMWVERLVIPRLQVRVEHIRGTAREGGR